MEIGMLVAAARAMTQLVERHGQPLTLRELKARTLPRSSWAHFTDVVVAGHLEGVLILSRIDLPAVYGTPEVTGEVAIGDSRYHWVKPRGWIG